MPLLPNTSASGNQSSTSKGRSKRSSGVISNHRETMPTEQTISLARRLFKKMTFRSSDSRNSHKQKDMASAKPGNSDATPCLLDYLPIELWIYILGLLELSCRLRIRRVSRRFKALVEMIPLRELRDVVHVSRSVDQYITRILTAYPYALRDVQVPKFAIETTKVIFKYCHRIKTMVITGDTLITLKRAGFDARDIKNWMALAGSSLQSLRISPRCAVTCPVQLMLPFFEAMSWGLLTRLENLSVELHSPTNDQDENSTNDQDENSTKTIAKAIAATTGISHLGIKDYRTRGMNANVGDILKAIGQLKSLETLMLKDMIIDVDSLKEILGLSPDDGQQSADRNDMADYEYKRPARHSPLKSLRIEGGGRIQTAHMVAMENMLPKLEHFSITNLSCEPRLLNSFLASTPHLKSLSLSTIDFMVLPANPHAWNILTFPKGLEQLVMDGSVSPERVDLVETIKRCCNLSSIVCCGSTELNDTHMRDVYSYLSLEDGRKHAAPSILFELVDCANVGWPTFVGGMKHNIRVMSQTLNCIRERRHHNCSGHAPLVVLKTLVDWRKDMEIFFRMCYVVDLNSPVFLEKALRTACFHKKLIEARWNPILGFNPFLGSQVNPASDVSVDEREWDTESLHPALSYDSAKSRSYELMIQRELEEFTGWIVEDFELYDLCPW